MYMYIMYVCVCYIRMYIYIYIPNYIGGRTSNGFQRGSAAGVGAFPAEVLRKESHPAPGRGGAAGRSLDSGQQEAHVLQLNLEHLGVSFGWWFQSCVIFHHINMG